MNFEMNKLVLKKNTIMKRILIVDDYLHNSLTLQKILESDGYQVEVAENGYAALIMIEASPPDLILMDLLISDLDGFELTRRIRQKSNLPFIPILLMMAYNKPEDLKAFETGEMGFINKPIIPDQLLSKIREIWQGEP